MIPTPEVRWFASGLLVAAVLVIPVPAADEEAV